MEPEASRSRTPNQLQIPSVQDQTNRAGGQARGNGGEGAAMRSTILIILAVCLMVSGAQARSQSPTAHDKKVEAKSAKGEATPAADQTARRFENRCLERRPTYPSGPSAAGWKNYAAVVERCAGSRINTDGTRQHHSGGAEEVHQQPASDGERDGNQQPADLRDGRSHQSRGVCAPSPHDRTTGTLQQQRIHTICANKEHLCAPD